MDNSFEFTYSAPDQEEIRRIRDKYLPKEADKMEQLRKLDRSLTRKGTVWSLILGILGTLIFGGGMSCCLVRPDTLLIPGIVLGILGAAVLASAYPVYALLTEKERKRLAPEILRLADELLK